MPTSYSWPVVPEAPSGNPPNPGTPQQTFPLPQVAKDLGRSVRFANPSTSIQAQKQGIQAIAGRLSSAIVAGSPSDQNISLRNGVVRRPAKTPKGILG